MNLSKKYMKPLTREFFARDTIDVARDLIGKLLVKRDEMAIITETEAYKWECDPASHAWPRKTARNQYMYDTVGHIYVYLIYGVNYCLNFTTEKEWKPWAVLIRWILPIKGVEKMQVRRGKDLEPIKLADWPWKLTKALGIDLSWNGKDLFKSDLQILDIGLNLPVEATPRIGISKAKDYRWRFVVPKKEVVKLTREIDLLK